MTPQELIDAVLPCLPLQLFDSIADGLDNAAPWVVFKHGSWCCEPMIPSMAEALVIGALDQACVENGWEVIRHAMLGHYTRINYGSMRSEFVSVNGTDAAAFCRAYAQAKEATR